MLSGKIPMNRAADRLARATGALRGVAWTGAVALVVLAVHVNCSGPRASDSGSSGRDNPAGAFVLFLTGHWQGQLEPCGCAEKQLGGIDRRTHLLNPVPSSQRLLFDAGPVVTDQDRQAQIKLETFLLAMHRLGYDGITLTPSELAVFREHVALDGASRPPIVATNLAADLHKSFGTVPVARKTLAYAGQELSCVMLAVCLPSPEDAPDVILTDPLEALRTALAEIDIDPDGSSTDHMVIVASPARDPGLSRTLAAVPAVDLVLTTGLADEPEFHATNNTAAVITTGNLGKYMSRIDLRSPIPTRVDQADFRTVAVQDDFPQDRAVVELIDNYQLQLEVEDLIATEGLLPRKPLPAGLYFTGNASCGQADCHESIYKKWNTFGHGHAMETLQRIARDYNPECVVCHVVGMDYEGGYRSMELTPELANVGCEACHGPGSEHAADPWAPYEVVWQRCEDCHTHENSPPFAENREEYFEKVRHWLGDLQYWQ